MPTSALALVNKPVLPFHSEGDDNVKQKNKQSRSLADAVGFVLSNYSFDMFELYVSVLIFLFFPHRNEWSKHVTVSV